jgi:hypothetical protein
MLAIEYYYLLEFLLGIFLLLALCVIWPWWDHRTKALKINPQAYQTVTQNTVHLTDITYLF